MNFSMKFGWIVYEDIYGAELCEEKLSKQVIRNCYLDAAILPDPITSESMLLDNATLQMEGLPSSLCTKEKISELLRSISPDLLISLKYVKVSFLN